MNEKAKKWRKFRGNEDGKIEEEGQKRRQKGKNEEKMAQK